MKDTPSADRTNTLWARPQGYLRQQLASSCFFNYKPSATAFHQFASSVATKLRVGVMTFKDLAIRANLRNMFHANSILAIAINVMYVKPDE